jgi:type I restriction enzyme S subunit
MKWEKVKLGDICKYVTSGGTPKSSIKEYYEPKQIPWLKTKEVNYCRIYETEAYISKDGLDNSSAKMIPQNSVIVAMYGQGDTAGRVAINKIPLTTNQACCNLIIDETKAYYEFVYYQLVTLYEKMVSLKNGGAQPNLNAAIIKSMEIKLPPLKTQRYIADILSSYDNLIENNQKQIKLLEEAAQRQYKEWFVDLRFPGHENTKFVDGVPEGWNWCKLEDAIQLDPKVTLTKERMKQFIPMSALSTSSMVLDESQFTETTSNSGSKFQNGDTLLARITPCLENGKTAYVSGIKSDEGAVGSTEYIVMRAKTINSYMVYLLARTDDFRQSAINSMSGSDGRQRVKSDKLKMLDYLHPTSELVEKFENVEEPIFEKIYRLSKQMQQAKQARDLLLPKLMSGEVEV